MQVFDISGAFDNILARASGLGLTNTEVLHGSVTCGVNADEMPMSTMRAEVGRHLAKRSRQTNAGLVMHIGGTAD